MIKRHCGAVNYFREEEPSGIREDLECRERIHSRECILRRNDIPEEYLLRAVGFITKKLRAELQLEFLEILRANAADGYAKSRY